MSSCGPFLAFVYLLPTLFSAWKMGLGLKASIDYVDEE